MIKKLLLPVLVLSASLSQVAFSHEDHKACPYFHCVQDAMKSANLSADQKIKLKALKVQLKESLQGKWTEVKAIQAQIKVLIRSDKMDEAKLDSLINQKKELMGAIMKTKIMLKHQMYNVLDAKQKASVSAKIDACEKDTKHE